MWLHHAKQATTLCGCIFVEKDLLQIFNIQCAVATAELMFLANAVGGVNVFNRCLSQILKYDFSNGTTTTRQQPRVAARQETPSFTSPNDEKGEDVRAT